MNVLDAAYHLVRAYPGGAQSLAPRMSKNPNTLNHEVAGDGTAKFGLVDAVAATQLSKNFVIWYSKRIAAQFGGRGARVVSVSPGSFDTPMGQLEADAGAGALAALGALKRFGRPAEIAELLAFCAGDKPGYLTGADIICDGGVMAAMTLRDALRLGRSQ